MMKYDISVIPKQECKRNWKAYLKDLNDYEEPKKQTLWDKIRDFIKKVIRRHNNEKQRS